VHAQNTRAGSDRTYHLVISLHPRASNVDLQVELVSTLPSLLMGFAQSTEMKRSNASSKPGVSHPTASK
jgi:hypothetical protein